VSAPRSGQGSSLPRRLLSAALWLPLVILAIHLGGWAWLLFIEAMVVLGLFEFYRMARHKGTEPHERAGVAAAAVLAGFMWAGHSAGSAPVVSLFFLLVLVLELRRGRPAGSIANVGATVLGVFYVGWLGGHLGLLRSLPGSVGPAEEVGRRVVYFTFLVTWAGDTGAYFTGRALGRRPLLPSVSPKKTVEGTIGGLAASTLVGLAAGHWMLPQLGPAHAAGLGFLAGVVGPIGDLVESLMKRDSGVKDAGEAIPGHGGVLDRFDSLLFVAPVIYYYLKYLVFHD
jgi:phosphatidate cytidylyltransferase